jgi:hypothetical protein
VNTWSPAIAFAPACTRACRSAALRVRFDQSTRFTPAKPRFAPPTPFNTKLVSASGSERNTFSICGA